MGVSLAHDLIKQCLSIFSVIRACLGEVKVEDTKRSRKFHRVNVIAAVGKVLTAEYLRKHAQGGRKPKRSLEELLILTLKQ